MMKIRENSKLLNSVKLRNDGNSWKFKSERWRVNIITEWFWRKNHFISFNFQ